MTLLYYIINSTGQKGEALRLGVKVDMVYYFHLWIKRVVGKSTALLYILL